MADTRDKLINWEGLSRFFQDLKTGYLDTKQDVLTAGEGVTIDTSTNTISVQGSGFNPTNNSHVEGINTDAEGENSHAEGEGTFTFGNASHAEGRSTVLSNYIQLLGRFTFTANSNTGLTTNSNDMYVGMLLIDRATTNALPIIHVLSVDKVRNTFTFKETITENISNKVLYTINDGAAGNYSHSEGVDTLATGMGSHAEGYNTIAGGDYSHSEGNETQALGNFSHTEGDFTLASGGCAHAEGVETTAHGVASHTEGYQTIAGSYAHAEGSGGRMTTFTTSIREITNDEKAILDKYGLKFNYVCTTGGFVSQDLGGISIYNTSGTTLVGHVLYSVASRDAWGLELTNLSTTGVWLRVESATENHIENGQYLFSRVSAAEGMCSHSEGIQALAKDECSHADGKLTTAFSKYSNATGYITEAVGFAAHSEGSSTVAGGGQAHAEGYQTIASSNNSHAEGSKTVAGGSQSHAEGLETIAAHDNEHAEGKYNKSNQLLVPPEGFVDLGLSVKWASNNLGATVSRNANDWYGVYYGWAEKNAKENYTDAGYDYGMPGNMTKYNATDHKEIIEAVDDVATVKLGTGFRIPSLAEIAELYDTEKITREWVMNYNGVSGLNGMIFVSKVPGFVGHYIFIPATGYIDGTTTTGAETTINFWTNTVDASNLDNAIHAVITTSGCTTGSCERHIGHTIRPVAATGSTKVNTIHSIGIGSSRTSRKNAVEVMDNGFVYVNGLGGYEGDNTESGTILTLQQVIKNLEARIAALEGN